MLLLALVPVRYIRWRNCMEMDNEKPMKEFVRACCLAASEDDC